MGLKSDLSAKRVPATTCQNHLVPLRLAASELLLRVLTAAKTVCGCVCGWRCSVLQPSRPSWACRCQDNARAFDPPLSLPCPPPKKNQTETPSFVVQYLGRDSCSLRHLQIIHRPSAQTCGPKHILHGPECGSWETPAYMSLGGWASHQHELAIFMLSAL